MLQQRLNHNEDIKRLVNEGYAVEIVGKYICVSNIPYVKSDREVAFATLLCPFNIQGNLITPVDHTMFSTGYPPCDHNGNRLSKIINSENTQRLTDDIVVNCYFSSKPSNGYRDFHHKFTTYIALLESQAQILNPNIKAKNHAPIKLVSVDSPFNYYDTNSSRSNIDYLNRKLQNQKIAIIGLGGTGSYILDFVSKTPVKEIHIYDADTFNTHNAFRSPGAASIDILDESQSKVAYYHNIYSKMHKHIIAHNEFVNENNLTDFVDCNFVFVAVDNNKSRMKICSYLTSNNIKYIDVGLGVNLIEDSLTASFRVSFPHGEDIEVLKNHCGGENQEDDIYASNIQIAELNALNAGFAIMKWKIESEYYATSKPFHTQVYVSSLNKIVYE